MKRSFNNMQSHGSPQAMKRLFQFLHVLNDSLQNCTLPWWGQYLVVTSILGYHEYLTAEAALISISDPNSNQHSEFAL